MGATARFPKLIALLVRTHSPTFSVLFPIYADIHLVYYQLFNRDALLSIIKHLLSPAEHVGFLMHGDAGFTYGHHHSGHDPRCLASLCLARQRSASSSSQWV